MGYEVEEEEWPVAVADHGAGMTVLAVRCDHLLAEVGDCSEDQGAENVDLEIPTNENPLVQQMES